MLDSEAEIVIVKAEKGRIYLEKLNVKRQCIACFFVTHQFDGNCDKTCSKEARWSNRQFRNAVFVQHRISRKTRIPYITSTFIVILP